MSDVPVFHLPEIRSQEPRARQAIKKKTKSDTAPRSYGLLIWILLWIVLGAGLVSTTRSLWRVLDILAEPPVAVIVATVSVPPSKGRSVEPALASAELTLVRAELERSKERLHELESTLARERRDHAHKRKIIGEMQAQVAASRVALAAPGGIHLPGAKATSSRSRPRRPRRNPLTTSTPTVRLIGSDALILGTVRNRSDFDVEARLLVELLIDGSPYGKDQLVVPVPAGATVPFSTKISTSLSEGTYSGRVTVQS